LKQFVNQRQEVFEKEKQEQLLVISKKECAIKWLEGELKNREK
jgi:hypothetical protein